LRATQSFFAVAVFGVSEVAYFVTYLLLLYEDRTELYGLTRYLDVASWFAFLVFAHSVFRPFNYRWLRVILAFIVFMVVPAAFSLAVTKVLDSADAAELWFELAFVATTALKLGIAGSLYAWGASRENIVAGSLHEE
jgi:hypothetical protein